PSKKGEYKHCTNCGAKLKEEEEEYSNNNNSSNNGGGKGVQALNLKLKLYSQGQENGKNDPYEYAGEFIERADAGGFLRVRFNLLQPLQPLATAKNFDQYDISHISKLSVHWDKIDDTAVCIGLITVEPMALVLSADANSSKSNPWANVTDSTIASAQKNSTFDTYNGKPTIRKEKNKEAKWPFLRPINFNSVNTLRLAISNKDNLAYTTPTLILVNSNNHTLELSLKKQNEMSSDRWLYYIVNIKEPTDGEKVSADDIKEIKNIGLKDLPENDSLYISEILGELNFENNFLISSDTDLNLSARMYINGMLCSMDHWETYLTQKDIPSDNTDYLLTSSVVVGTAENQEQYGKAETISYMVYADVWNRGITHLEDPQIREVALGGPDTATKMKTICQIKLKEIPDDLNLQDKMRLAEYEIKKLSEEGTCRLSIVYPRNSSLSDSKSNFGMLGNHLYRIQIHDGGEEGEMNKNNNNNNRATFKWSKENASVAFAIKKISENEVVLEQGGRRLDNSNVFRIGGLIEIIDDLDELSEQPRGQMRRITHIDVGKRTLSWSSRAEGSDQMDVKYLHEPVTIRSGRY
ncbi:MAG TPA: DUF6519 domain-containing protein, partial [Nitrososphaeraceae archaeon]|nr:DUF6519 domain-containing protein [Nitrososphaeraceae archaeon]